MAHQPGFEPQFDPYRSDVQRSVTPDQPHPAFNEPLLPPSAPYLAPSEGALTPRDSYAASNSVTNSTALLPGVGEKGLTHRGDFTARGSKPLRKKPLIWVLAAAALLLIAAAVVVPVYFTVIKPKNNTVSGGTGGSNGGGDPNNPTHNPTNSISGGDGSTITAEDGSQFTYSNPYGGICGSSSNFLRPHGF